MKRKFVIAAITLLVFTAGSAAWYVKSLHHKRLQVTTGHATTANSITYAKALDIATNAKQYAAAHHFNTQFCFLVDMSIASGKERFLVYDFIHDTISQTGLVTHGRCNQQWLNGRQYGNTIGCGCTSLGKYKIGHPYQGRFGLAYKLYGLDTSNSNADNRFVVLHSHSCVPGQSVDPKPICQSDGCPTVSPVFLTKLAALIDKSPQPVLLWIYQ